MSHSSEKRWARDVSSKVSAFSTELVSILNSAEEGYQQMQEIYLYAGGTVTDLAALLFKEDIADRGDSGPNQEEIDKVTDAVGAMTAAHQIYEAANNIAVTQEDRMTDLRRMI